MLKLSMRFWVLAALILMVNVAGLIVIRNEMLSRPVRGLRLLSIGPGGDINEADRFVLRFDEPLARVEECGARIEHSPFVIDPQPAGHWQWAEPDQLVYMLEEKLPPGRQYVIKPAADFDTRHNRRIIGQSEYTFATRPLQWKSARIVATDRAEATVALAFNQPVRPDDLARHLTVHDVKARGRLAAQCLNQSAASELTIRFPRPTGDAARIMIAPQLTGDGGTLALGSEVNHTIVISPIFKLTGAEASHDDDDETVDVYVRFSQPLSTAQKITPTTFTLSPAVKDVRTIMEHDGKGLFLRGDFAVGQRYTVTLGANLLSAKKETLGSAQSTSFTVPDREPSLVLPDSKGILSPHGNLTLDLRAVNIEAFTLTAWKLHSNNLVPYLRGDDEDATSRQLVQREIKIKTKKNETQTVAVDLKQVLEKTAASPGTYKLEARATTPYWLRSRALVCITDLALTTRQDKQGYHILVTSLRTAQPVPGVRISAISFNNQTLAEAETDATGLAQLRVSSEHPDGGTYVIAAQLGDNLSYTQPGRRPWVIDDVDQAGKAYPKTYDVMLYPERGVYRPGDVVHLTGIVRDAEGKTPPPLPLVVRVKRPDGKQVAELTTPRDAAQGVFHVDFPSSGDGQTGRYTFSVTLPGSNQVLGQCDALIEAFVPIRIEVKASPSAPRFGPKEQPKINVDARYLFGQPAAGLPLSISPTLKSAVYESTSLPDYTFNTGAAAQRVEIETIDDELDAEGKASVAIAPPNDLTPRLWRGTAAATVTEPGGRSVSQNTTFTLDTIDRHLGLRMTGGAGGSVLRTHAPTQVDWQLVSGSDQPIKPGKMRIQLDRLEHDWTLQDVDGNAVWKSIERSISIMDESFQPDETRGFTIQATATGNHRLTMTETTTGVRSEIRFFAAQQAELFTSPPVTSPQKLELVLDKKTYTPGETAQLIVRSPFQGTLHVTVETDRVIEQHVIAMKENSATLELSVDRALRGGAFITASVIRPIDPSRNKWLPHRAMGKVRLVTDHSASSPVLELTAPDRAEPGQQIAIDVRTETPADPSAPPMVHVWAVDDGILLTTGFKTPQPRDFFFAPRIAAVTAGDVFADLLPDHQRPADMQRIGAGPDDDEDLRRSSVPMKQREAAVVWRTAQPVGADGKLSIAMTMPKITGRMRVMAVIVEGDRYNSVQREVTLTSPLLVETSWPRFAAPGDVFQVPVKLFNSTEQPLSATLSFEATGGVEISLAEQDSRIEVKPNEPRTIWLRAKATALGPVTAVITVKASIPGRELVSTSDAALAVRPITPLHVDTRLVRTKAGDALPITRSDSLLPGISRLTLSISGNPTVELRPAVEELLDYPYGCIEQTTSRLLAILHAPQLLSLESSDDVRIEESNAMIGAGIARLWSMQTRSGGLSYWPGDARAYGWGTMYAADFLVKARRAGHRVDPRFLEELVNYLQSEHQRGELGASSIDANTRAQLVHVLAALGQPDEAWIARLAEKTGELDMAGRAHLAGAWFEIGRRDKALAALPDDTMGMIIPTATSGQITSQTRQEAVLLDTLLDIKPDHAWVPLLVRKLESQRKGGYWGTTLDTASALCALSKYQATRRGQDRFTGAVRIGEGQSVSFDHTKPVHVKVPAGDQPISVQSQGKGDVYVTLSERGLLKPDLIKPYERNLRVTRIWSTREGDPVDTGKLKVGDLIYVDVTLAAPGLAGDAQVDNIAVVDALPAGLEVENPRLLTSAAAEEEEGAAKPDRIEFLDDRVILFSSVRKQPRTFRYLLRVTTVGEFALPPVQASCMYDTSFAAMGDKGVVVVK